VVPGTLAKRVVPGDSPPGLAPVIRAEQPTAVGFDQRIDSAPVRWGNGDAHLPPDAARQTFIGQLLPGVSSVARYIKPAARSAAHQLPGAATRLPKPGEHNAGVSWIEGNV